MDNQTSYPQPQESSAPQQPSYGPQNTQPQYAAQPQSMMPQPTQPANYFAPQPEVAPAPKPRLPIALVAITIVSLLSALGAGSYAMLASRKASQKTAPATTKVDVISPLTAGMTMEYVRGIFTAPSGAAKTSLTTPVETKGHSYLTIVADPQAVAKTSLTENVTPKEADTALAALRKALGEQRYAETVITDGANNANFLADYNRSDVTCQVAVTKTPDTAANQVVEVKCIDQSQYEALAATQEPFFKAYSAASAASAAPVLIGAPVITASATAGYQLAEQKTATAPTHHSVTAGPTIKLYAAADNVWHYFTDSSSVLACTVYYKQPATTAAYVGTPCRNDKNQTVTVLPKKN